jgi:hypothetical protein
LLLEFFVHLICWLAVAAPSHKSEQDGEQDLGLSKNATFRAIQPSSQLLRHIDDHLLGRRRLVEWRNGGYHTDLRAPLDDVPHGNTEGWLPIQETVFKLKLTFVAAAKKSSSLPPQELPEIAFAGITFWFCLVVGFSIRNLTLILQLLWLLP